MFRLHAEIPPWTAKNGFSGPAGCSGQLGGVARWGVFLALMYPTSRISLMFPRRSCPLPCDPEIPLEPELRAPGRLRCPFVFLCPFVLLISCYTAVFIEAPQFQRITSTKAGTRNEAGCAAAVPMTLGHSRSSNA